MCKMDKDLLPLIEQIMKDIVATHCLHTFEGTFTYLSPSSLGKMFTPALISAYMEAT